MRDKLLTCGLTVLATQQVFAETPTDSDFKKLPTPKELNKSNLHIVRKGECFSQIVQKYKAQYPKFNFKELYTQFQNYNPMKDYDRIEIDQELHLPPNDKSLVFGPFPRHLFNGNSSIQRKVVKTNVTKGKDIVLHQEEFAAKEAEFISDQALSNESTTKETRKTVSKVNPFYNPRAAKFKVSNIESKLNSKRNPFVFVSSYRVQMGDTLSKVAKDLFPNQNKTKVIKAILEVNPKIKNPRVLSAGSLINIPEQNTIDRIRISSFHEKTTKTPANLANARKRNPSAINIQPKKLHLSEEEEKNRIKALESEIKSQPPIIKLSKVERITYRAYLKNISQLQSTDEKIDELVFLKSLSQKLKHPVLEAKFLKIITDVTKLDMAQSSDTKSNEIIDSQINTLISDFES